MIVEAKRLVDSVAKLTQFIVSTLKEYAQVNEAAVNIIALYASVLENISNMGLHYVLFNKCKLKNFKLFFKYDNICFLLDD